MNALRPNQMAAWIAQVKAELPADVLPVVLDVREAWEVQTASVKPDGFELVHMPMQTIPARLQDLPHRLPVPPRWTQRTGDAIPQQPGV
jgi:rhodanese-related sulfurtransferase